MQEIQGKLKNALLAIIQANKSLPKYFAGIILFFLTFYLLHKL